VQWTAVYIAAAIASLAGGWVAEHLKPQTVFSINGLFPLIILGFVLFFIKEERSVGVKEQFAMTRQALGVALRQSTFWILAFFLFFWTFSPSIGTPFFYYAVDNLKFSKIFIGIAGAVSSAASALGAVIFWKYSPTLKAKAFVKLMIITGVAATLFNLVYFTSFIRENLFWARIIYIFTSAIIGIISTLTFLVLMNAAALATTKFSEGTTFAFLTSFWNIGLIGSSALGGWLFAKIGLQPLVIISALFTAVTWLFLPYLKFGD
jgi:Na+/melibiose symporter-like transporter